MALLSEFLQKGKELCQRMRSPEGATLSRGDLEVLREQLHLLHSETVNLLIRRSHKIDSLLCRRVFEGGGANPGI